MSNPRTNRTRSTAKPTSSRGTMARSRNRKQEKRDSIIEEVKKARKRLVPKKYTTEGKNPRSLPAGSGPPSLAELNKKRTSSRKATPEGGRAGFMAGMTGGQDKKKTPTKSRMQKDQDMISGIGARAAADNKKTSTTRRPPIDFRGAFGNNKTTTDKPKRSFMSSGAKRTTTRTKPVDNKVNYSEATKPQKRATTKVDNKVNYSEATKPQKRTKKSAMPSDFSRVLPKGSEDLIGDNKVNYSEVTRPQKVAKKDTDKKKTTTKKVEPKKKSFRERRLDRMGKRLASAESEGRKRRIKRRMERVKGRIADDEKKKSKGMMGGGMMKSKMSSKGGTTGGKMARGMKGGGMKTKGSMAGGKMKTKGYSTGGVKKPRAKKMRGAGIERRGYRPAKMY